MNTRRKFLLQGSLAATALLTAKPFKSAAGVFGPVSSYAVNENKIILVHTGSHEQSRFEQAAEQIADLKKRRGNLVHLHTGDPDKNALGETRYDAVLKTEECISVAANNYRIIHRGNIKIGIITVNAGEKDTVEKVNNLSAYLKKEKDCRLVVCLSKLGYKTDAIDDKKLATQSLNLDIVISAHNENYFHSPVIAMNGNNEEVIIHADSGNDFAFGNIEIGFNMQRNKTSIAINDLTKRQPAIV